MRKLSLSLFLSLLMGFFTTLFAITDLGFDYQYNETEKSLTMTHKTTDSSSYYYYLYNYNTATPYRSGWIGENTYTLDNVVPGKYYLKAYIRGDEGQLLSTYQKTDIALDQIEPIIDKGFTVEYDGINNQLEIQHLTDNSKKYYYYLYNYNTGEKYTSGWITDNYFILGNVVPGKYYVKVYIQNHLMQSVSTYQKVDVALDQIEPIIDKGFETSYDSTTKTFTINHLTDNSKKYYYYLYNYNTGDKYRSNWISNQSYSIPNIVPGKYYVKVYIQNHLMQNLSTYKKIDVALDQIEPIIDKGFETSYDSTTKTFTINHLTDNSKKYYYYLYNYNTGDKYRSNWISNQSYSIPNIVPGKYYVKVYIQNHLMQNLSTYKKIDVALDQIEPIIDKGFETSYDSTTNQLKINHLTTNAKKYYFYLYNYNTSTPYRSGWIGENTYTLDNVVPGKYYVKVYIQNHLIQNLSTYKKIDVALDQIEPIIDKGFTVEYDASTKTLNLIQKTTNAKDFYYYLYNRDTGMVYRSGWIKNNTYSIPKIQAGNYYIKSYIKNHLMEMVYTTQNYVVPSEEALIGLLSQNIDKSNRVISVADKSVGTFSQILTQITYTSNGTTATQNVYHTGVTLNGNFTLNIQYPLGLDTLFVKRTYTYTPTGTTTAKTKTVTLDTLNYGDLYGNIVNNLSYTIDTKNKKITLNDTSKGSFTSIVSKVTKNTIAATSSTENINYSTNTLNGNYSYVVDYSSDVNGIVIENTYTYVEDGVTKTKTTTIEFTNEQLNPIVINQFTTTIDKTNKKVSITDTSSGTYTSVKVNITKTLEDNSTTNETINYPTNALPISNTIDFDYVTGLSSIKIDVVYQYVVSGISKTTTNTKTLTGSDLYNTQESLTPEQQKIFDNATSVQMQQYGTAIKLQAAYDQGYTGKGVLVGVVEGNFGLDFADSINDKIVNKGDLVAGTINAGDTEHMNHVASSITGDPLKGWTKGVAYKADLALFNGFTSGLNNALTYNNNNTDKLDVINNSWGSSTAFTGTDSRNYADYYTQASLIGSQTEYQLLKQGTTLVKAAGNNGALGCDATGEDACDPFALKWTYIMDKYSSEVSGGVIIVGSYDKNTGALYSYSNRAGDLMKDYYLVAPGSYYAETGSGAGTIQTDANGNVLIPGSVGYKTGTSMAAPLVTGVYALLREKHPNLTGQEITKIMFDTATDLGATGIDDVYGNGLINVEAAFNPVGTLSVADTSSGTLREGREISTPTTFVTTSGIISNKLQGISIPVLDDYGRLFNQKIQTK